ncbi:MAG: tetratricopeptide repeat protein [bacterium]|nr:tetratricopeptide repeat protein [bacterium]
MDGMKRGIVLVCGMALWLAVGAAGAEQGSYWYAVDHVTTVDEDARMVVWATLPPDWHGQAITVGNIVPEPVGVFRDPRTGNRVVEWLVEPEAGNPVLSTFFHYEFDFTERPVRMAIDPAAVKPYDEDSEFFRTYTAPETWIPVDGPVRHRALAIVGGETNPWLQAGLIYDWIIGELVFEIPGPAGRDAASVLDARRGECEQFSVLMVAMCRSLGIPARTVTNAWTTGGDHVFVEFWLEGYGWVPADPSLGQMLGPGGGGFGSEDVTSIMESRNVPLGDPRWLLGNLFDGRLVISVGNDIAFDSPTLGRRVTLHSARPGGDRARPDGFLIEGLNDDLVHGGFFVFGRRLADEDEAHDLTHHRLADRFFDVGMVDIVEDVCRASIEQDAAGVTPWLNMGRVYMHKGQYYKAEAAFKRALITPSAKRTERLAGLIWAHNYLGNLYDLMDRRDMALAEYQAVVERGNNFRGAVDYAGRFLEEPFTGQ